MSLHRHAQDEAAIGYAALEANTPTLAGGSCPVARCCREVFSPRCVENLSYSRITAHSGIGVTMVEKNIARLLLGAERRP